MPFKKQCNSIVYVSELIVYQANLINQ